MMRSAPPCSAERAISPELQPAPMIGLPSAICWRKRSTICVRVNGREAVTCEWVSLCLNENACSGRCSDSHVEQHLGSYPSECFVVDVMRIDVHGNVFSQLALQR